jgi:hypothetical protein
MGGVYRLRGCDIDSVPLGLDRKKGAVAKQPEMHTQR